MTTGIDILRTAYTAWQQIFTGAGNHWQRGGEGLDRKRFRRSGQCRQSVDADSVFLGAIGGKFCG
jgi:hypothetical protein